VIWGRRERMPPGEKSSSELSLEKSLEKKSWTEAELKGMRVLDETSRSSNNTCSGKENASKQEGGIPPQAIEVMKKAGMWSVGSAKHGTGLCRPCHYAHTKEGCKDKEACEFCHLPHTDMGQKKKRPCPKRRQQVRMLANHVNDALLLLGPEESSDVVDNFTSGSAYMHRVLNRIQHPEQSQPRNVVTL